MKAALVWIAIVAVTAAHAWASQRQAKYWYLGGIAPALWGGVHLALHLCGRIDWSRDGEAILYAAVILVLIWIVGRLQVRLRPREGEEARP